MAAAALVTGAAQGIGRAIAARLVADGYDVVVADLDGDRAATTALELGARSVQLDVSDVASVRACAADVGPISLLVNNAGIVRGGTLGALSVQDYRQVMDVNVLGILLMTQAFTESLVGTSGSVINLSSISAQVNVPGTGIYSASKAAVTSLTQGFALELGPRGVRVNAVAPGRIATELLTSRPTDPAREARTVGLIPVRRVGQPEDIADVVSFLASPAARYVAGQVLVVDGGLAIGTMPFFMAAQAGGA